MKKLVSLVLALAMMLSLVSFASAEEAATFNVLSGISALSSGYDGNTVLAETQENSDYVRIGWL